MYYQLKKKVGYVSELSTGQRLTTRSMAAARRLALQFAQDFDETVNIERVTDGPLEGREGFERGRNVDTIATVLVVQPDGSFSTPPKAKTIGPPHTDEPGRACFCTNCRAVRKARTAPFTKEATDG
jgi:hypothetical protein